MIGKQFTQLDWDDLRHFLALSRSGTLLGAAKQLGVEHATISRRVASLEAKLGRKLIDRRGRRIILTADGEQVASLAAPMASQISAIEQLGRSSSTEARGHVKISAPPALSAALLAEPVVALREKFPGIQITLVGEKRFASLDRREADIAIRLSRPEEGDYQISRLGVIAFALYASADYIERVPSAEWVFIGYDEAMNASPQQLRLLEIALTRPLAIKSSILEFQIAAAQAGGGVVMLPDFAVSLTIGLRRVGEERLLEREIWLVVHSDVKDVPAIRVVVEALSTAFGR
ncbi:LysR family transcriptional regulator [Rhizobium sp. CG5]|uniref:LysR family transcriptional regulator n=1 Tax=Rhizobium sp. CG5 TaxID=2726076 RepID=UPI0020345532|nr:LysR family transcriptional regulator [Rhizobium sp. CG5]MCM2476363.1 LysR family transcriptional regulator [Rhizobium sp. CG5]